MTAILRQLQFNFVKALEIQHLGDLLGSHTGGAGGAGVVFTEACEVLTGKLENLRLTFTREGGFKVGEGDFAVSAVQSPSYQAAYTSNTGNEREG